MLLSDAVESNAVTLGQRVTVTNAFGETFTGVIAVTLRGGVYLTEVTGISHIGVTGPVSFWIDSRIWEVADVAI